MLSQKHRDNIKKIKNVKWLVPGWVFYEFYKLHKIKGNTHVKSAFHGAKAEVIRLAAFASFPLPGTYELTTGSFALLKKRIEIGEIYYFNLKIFKDFVPVKITKNKKVAGKPYLKMFYNNRKLNFEVFYK